MEPEMRKRYMIVRIQDVLDYFVDKGVKPRCPQCSCTNFTFQLLNETDVDENGAPIEPSVMDVFEYHGQDTPWAFYPLSCMKCSTFIHLDAEKILEWTEKKRPKDASATTTKDEGLESGV
ncbi:hypothetical protein KAM339_006480 [Aeromonas caviae]|uniref:hypothetical protein n=1 Tax=Aeromonas caviae TaxID=648 RepID=UPI001CC3F68C|nr:hypothetical protein [Aeromonas caviae]BDA12107.1 hypothetical protein KAM339_006480 [Aeromonas caviae]